MTTPPSSPSRPGLTRFAQRGSARLAYEPPAAAGDGPAVLLLHDLLADRSALAPLRDALAAAGDPPYRPLLPDARGHGASPAFAARRATLADLAADALAVLDAEALPTAHVVGHGLGGATALALARLAPGRVRSLVLVEPDLPGLLAADPRPAARAAHAAARDAYCTAADLADKDQTDRALDLLLDARWGAGWRDRLSRPRLAAVRRHARALGPLLAALADDAPTTADGAASAPPALLLQRPDAPPLTGLLVAHLAAALPSARRSTLPPEPEGGPAAPGAPPVALAEPVVAFLAEIERHAATPAPAGATTEPAEA